jgi:hypothetical protein
MKYKAILVTAVAMAASAFLVGCGGGGDTSSAATSGASTTPSTASTGSYYYAQHDGNYSCVATGTTTAVTFSAKFSASNLVITPNGVLAGFGSYTIKDKVGFISSLPYYSANTELTSNAETYFFFNNNLTIVAGPAADVPNLLAQRPKSVTNCIKIS